jgi:4'-phosphopantetheinyl transferase EntD
MFGAPLFDPADQIAMRLASLAKAVHRDILTGCRAVTLGDEFALTAAEVAPIQQAVTSVRRASGSARIIARRLLMDLRADHVELPRTETGAPLWPPGFIGSLSHDEGFAVAAVSCRNTVTSIGIDIEPALPLPGELLELVATPTERDAIGDNLLVARLLFCMKEAVYKATHPIDGVFLDNQDVEVCMATSSARTKTGFTLFLQTATYPRLLALTAVVG